jgi:hypothetical protein
MYSKDYSPSAQAGIYFVYLFAADGSRVYRSAASVPGPDSAASAR